ncbi:hypothetical protein, partial [Chromatium okenii]|uniref:hypothetical protein n=1 Tax=Chromatium okenii TaxID=61644 RepID=UPI001A932CCE
YLTELSSSRLKKFKSWSSLHSFTVVSSYIFSYSIVCFADNYKCCSMLSKMRGMIEYRLGISAVIIRFLVALYSSRDVFKAAGKLR